MAEMVVFAPFFECGFRIPCGDFFQGLLHYYRIELMQVQLPNLHMVAYKSTDNLKDVVQCQKSQRPMLTEYFKMNATNPNAHQYLYKEFAEYFTWNKSGKYWKPRFAKRNRLHISRLVYVNPSEGDRYYLQVLLNHVRGATSYENLKTWYGITNETFRAATEAMGIFATIMVFCECTNMRHLWDKHYESLPEDFRRANDNNTVVE
ncbi:uncharacterized protein [Setaria viridis]|uniref:uncharacterized protein n=1 Tax=Setaria viridis TaxID=4556 RepID=UPI003B3A2285